MGYLFLNLFRGSEINGWAISDLFLKLVEVHRLLYNVSDLIEIVFGHFSVLLDGLFDFHLLLEELIVLTVGFPALWRYDLHWNETLLWQCRNLIYTWLIAFRCIRRSFRTISLWVSRLDRRESTPKIVRARMKSKMNWSVLPFRQA